MSLLQKITTKGWQAGGHSGEDVETLIGDDKQNSTAAG